MTLDGWYVSCFVVGEDASFWLVAANGRGSCWAVLRYISSDQAGLSSRLCRKKFACCEISESIVPVGRIQCVWSDAEVFPLVQVQPLRVLDGSTMAKK